MKSFFFIFLGSRNTFSVKSFMPYCQLKRPNSLWNNEVVNYKVKAFYSIKVHLSVTCCGRKILKLPNIKILKPDILPYCQWKHFGHLSKTNPRWWTMIEIDRSGSGHLFNYAPGFHTPFARIFHRIGAGTKPNSSSQTRLLPSVMSLSLFVAFKQMKLFTV